MRVVRCRACGQPMVFLETAAGRMQPCDAATVGPNDAVFIPEVHTSHFATCTSAEEFRRRTAKAQDTPR